MSLLSRSVKRCSLLELLRVVLCTTSAVQSDTHTEFLTVLTVRLTVDFAFLCAIVQPGMYFVLPQPIFVFIDCVMLVLSVLE